MADRSRGRRRHQGIDTTWDAVLLVGHNIGILCEGLSLHWQVAGSTSTCAYVDWSKGPYPYLNHTVFR